MAYDKKVKYGSGKGGLGKCDDKKITVTPGTWSTSPLKKGMK